MVVEIVEKTAGYVADCWGDKMGGSMVVYWTDVMTVVKAGWIVVKIVDLITETGLDEIVELMAGCWVGGVFVLMDVLIAG